MLMELPNEAAMMVATLIFVISSMLATGTDLTVSQIFEPIHNIRPILLALLANFVLMPLGAIALARVLWLDEPFGVGLLVLGCSAGAPFLPKLAELAKGDLAFAVGMMVTLMIVTIVYVPIVLPLLLLGVSVDAWKIARSLVLLMLLPLAAGVVVKARCEELAGRMKSIVFLNIVNASRHDYELTGWTVREPKAMTLSACERSLEFEERSKTKWTGISFTRSGAICGHHCGSCLSSRLLFNR